MAGEGGIGMMRRKAEIDTSAQFRSVKEAVLLYDELVLATEAYANKIQQMQEKPSASIDEQVKVELQETKDSLLKAREDGMVMKGCISSLQEELERTRKELQRLKEVEKSSSSSDIISKQQVRTVENLEFMEDSTQFDRELVMDRDEVVKNKVEFQKRYVTFENHSTPFARVMLPPPPNYSDHHAAVLQRHPSLRKKKKKSLLPFIGGIFSRKKASSSAMV